MSIVQLSHIKRFIRKGEIIVKISRNNNTHSREFI